MNRDDIIRMAREASGGTVWWPINSRDVLERFAALVAAAEREECAKVCEEERERLFWQENVQVISADKLAVVIRARGEK